MKEKGVSLLFSIFLFTILLGISLGISHFATRQIQMLRETGYSVNAFYAADSGVERAIKEIVENNSCPSSGLVNGGSYNVYCECCDKDSNSNCPNPEPSCPANCPLSSPTSNCRAFNFCLKVIGTYSGVSQAIQIEY
jgi:hypothetical protein